MKIFINSLNRADVISTHLLLDECGIDYKIILHDEEQKAAYLKNPTISEDKILVANQPIGMVGIRDWMNKNLVEMGEWYLILDDNITAFQAVPSPYYEMEQLPVKQETEKFKNLFEQEIRADRFLEICKECIEKAEKRGARLVGFASNVNFFFREKKWRDVGYVIGKTQLIKRSDLEYDLNVFATDDYLWTVQNLQRFGRVLVNNFAVGIKKHYAQGGIGKYEQRLPWKKKDLVYIMQKYPGILRYKQKAGKDADAEVQLRFTSTAQVDKWRFALKNLT